MKEIVIKIDEEDYDIIQNTSFVANTEMTLRATRKDLQQLNAVFGLIDAMRNGKVLPKGHGRLIDADKYVKSICDYCDGSCDFVGCDCLNCHEDCRCEFAKEMDDVDVLVEADKEDPE